MPPRQRSNQLLSTGARIISRLQIYDISFAVLRKPTTRFTLRAFGARLSNVHMNPKGIFCTKTQRWVERIRYPEKYERNIVRAWYKILLRRHSCVRILIVLDPVSSNHPAQPWRDLVSRCYHGAVLLSKFACIFVVVHHDTHVSWSKRDIS